MKLAISTNAILDNAVNYCKWTQMYFEEMCVALMREEATQNGQLSDETKALLSFNLPMGYNRLKSRFDVDNRQMDDEEETLVRLMDTLSADQYVALAKAILTPYQHLEFDEASLERLDKLGDS